MEEQLLEELPRATTETAAFAWRLLDGDLSAAGPLSDKLRDDGRPGDAGRLAACVGGLLNELRRRAANAKDGKPRPQHRLLAWGQFRMNVIGFLGGDLVDLNGAVAEAAALLDAPTLPTYEQLREQSAARDRRRREALKQAGLLDEGEDGDGPFGGEVGHASMAPRTNPFPR